MFAYMDALIKLDLSSFDTSNVTDMSEMFVYMDSLTKLDLFLLILPMLQI